MVLGGFSRLAAGDRCFQHDDALGKRQGKRRRLGGDAIRRRLAAAWLPPPSARGPPLPASVGIGAVASAASRLLDRWGRIHRIWQ